MGWGGVHGGEKKKLGGDGLVAWSGEGEGATRLTPHHLLPRLSEDRGRARVRGGVCERVHGEKHTCICVHAPVCVSVGGWVSGMADGQGILLAPAASLLVIPTLRSVPLPPHS